MAITSDAIDIQVFVEPSARTWTEWTPKRIRIAEQQADAGYLRLAADLCEEMFADDRVQGVLGVRTLGLAQLPVSFEDGSGPSRMRKRASKWLEAQEDWYTISPEYTLSEIDRWGVMLGVCPVQKIWQTGPKERLVPVLDPWHPRSLRFDRGKWMIDTEDAGAVEITKGPRWGLYTPFGRKRPWVHGAWRAVARWWLLKQFARSDWGNQGERAAGIRVVTTKAVAAPVVDATGQDAKRDGLRKRIVEELLRMARNGSIALPPDWDLKVVQAAANTYQTFQEQIAIANAGIAIALAGQNLSSEVSGGSYAAAQVHATIANVLLSSDAESLSTFMHDDVLGDWASYNLGDAALAPWPSWDTTPPANLLTRAQTWTQTAEAVTKLNALLAPKGVEVDVKEVARSMGVPVLEIEEETATGGGRSSPTTSNTGSSP